MISDEDLHEHAVKVEGVPGFLSRLIAARRPEVSDKTFVRTCSRSSASCGALEVVATQEGLYGRN